MLILYLSLLDTEEEKEKFEQLYYKYRKLMKHIAYDILKDPHLAEDAVHNAFLKLTKYLEKIEEINCHKTKSFIVIVIKSVSKDMYRLRHMEDSYLLSYQKYIKQNIFNKIEPLPSHFVKCLHRRGLLGFNTKIVKTI